MDPIPVIDLNEYDLSYELQFTTFMITLLEPYIRFGRKSEAPEIYRKGGKSPAGEERISVKEYVYFIQYTFPNIIDTEIRLMKEKILDERTNKDRLYQLHVASLSYKIKGKPVSETTLLIHSASARHILAGKARHEDNWEVVDEIYEMFKDMSQGEIDEQKRYYDVGQNVGIGRNTNPPSKTFLKDMYAYEEHLEYLLKIKRINKENNGKVKDVIAFLDHLQYIYD